MKTTTDPGLCSLDPSRYPQTYEIHEAYGYETAIAFYVATERARAGECEWPELDTWRARVLSKAP